MTPFLIVSSKGLLVNNNSTTRLAIGYHKWQLFQQNWNNFFTVNSLVVSGGKSGFRYLANKYLGVFIHDKIGQNFGVFLTTALFTLELRHKMHCVYAIIFFFQKFGLNLSEFIHLSSSIRSCVNVLLSDRREFISSRNLVRSVISTALLFKEVRFSMPPKKID